MLVNCRTSNFQHMSMLRGVLTASKHRRVGGSGENKTFAGACGIERSHSRGTLIYFGPTTPCINFEFMVTSPRLQRCNEQGHSSQRCAFSRPRSKLGRHDPHGIRIRRFCALKRGVYYEVEARKLEQSDEKRLIRHCKPREPIRDNPS